MKGWQLKLLMLLALAPLLSGCMLTTLLGILL